MALPTLFTNLLGKLGIKIQTDSTRINSPSTTIRQINISFFGNQINSIDKLKKELANQKPVLSKDLEVNVSESVTVTESVLLASGNLQMTKITNNPTNEELELVQLARGKRPYNSISDVHITYDEKGNIVSLNWTES